MTCDKSDS